MTTSKQKQILLFSIIVLLSIGICSSVESKKKPENIDSSTITSPPSIPPVTKKLGRIAASSGNTGGRKDHQAEGDGVNVNNDKKTRQNHDSSGNKTATATNDGATITMTTSVTDPSSTNDVPTNDKLPKPESPNSSISTPNNEDNDNGEQHKSKDMMNSTVDTPVEVVEAVTKNDDENSSGRHDDNDDSGSTNVVHDHKGADNEELKHHNNNDNGRPGVESIFVAGNSNHHQQQQHKHQQQHRTDDEELLPAPPMLSWDYIVNDADNDDQLLSRPFTQLYDAGIDAYLENNWRDCILYLETAIHEFRVFRHALINCRVQCYFVNEQLQPFFGGNIEQLQFFDLITRRALCLGDCHNKLLRKQYLPPFHLHRVYRDRFISKKPYEYLQLCYYKVSGCATNANLS